MASTSSFDVVSDFDRQELVNTLDQGVRRDVGNRYDLKDSNTEIDLEETELVITTASDMTLQAVEDVLRTKATKRNLSLKIFDFQTPESVGGNRVKQVVKLRKGLSQEIAKKLSKIVRDELKKVTVAIQGRVFGSRARVRTIYRRRFSWSRARKMSWMFRFSLRTTVDSDCSKDDNLLGSPYDSRQVSTGINNLIRPFVLSGAMLRLCLNGSALGIQADYRSRCYCPESDHTGSESCWRESEPVSSWC